MRNSSRLVVLWRKIITLDLLELNGLKIIIKKKLGRCRRREHESFSGHNSEEKS